MLIDGAYGEGGGQVVRTSLALSAITGQPVEIFNVRGRRKKPGLQPQHLAAVRAAAEICGASVRGDAVGSTHLSFHPQHPVKAGDYRWDIGTAGSATLVIQTVLVPLALAGAPSRISVTGGTHNPMAPSADYLGQVVIPAYQRFGLDVAARCSRAGFFPRGGGEVEVEIRGRNIQGATFCHPRGEAGLSATITSVNLPRSIAERGRTAFSEEVPLHAIEIREAEGEGPGVAVLATFRDEEALAGFQSLGERGKTMEKVCEESTQALRLWMKSGAAVDEHLADQLVLPAMFAGTPSQWRTHVVTEHLRTMAWLVPQFLAVRIEVRDDGLVTVTPNGDTMVASNP